MEIKFKLEGEYIELNKLLKITGLCATGGMAKIAIDEGYVKVDGETEFRKRCKMKVGQMVEYGGNTIEIVT